MFLTITHATGYINGILDFGWIFNGIRSKIKKISGDECHYEKNYMKIKFNSDDDLPIKISQYGYNYKICF